MKLLYSLLLTITLITVAYGQGAGTAASIYRTAFASLGTPANGSVRYCTDCTVNTAPCTGGGTGAFANRVNGAWSCETAGAVAGGDVVGPASSTDNAAVRFDSTTGKLVQNSLLTIDDSGSPNIPTGQTYKINNVALAKGDVGLNNVDNTSDANKPVSTAQAAADALNLKISLNLSDLNSASTARTNLGGTTVGIGFFTFTNPSAIRFPRIETDNSVTGRTAAQLLSDIGAQASITFGTGVQTALGVNVGSAGSIVVNGGVLGTPSSGSAVNLTGLPLAGLATQATNTVVGNATSGTAVPTALAVGSCSTAGSALIWTTNTGFGCNTSITAAAAPVGGLTGAGTGVLTFLATPSSANLAAAVTDETGSTKLVFSDVPTLKGTVTITAPASGRALKATALTAEYAAEFLGAATGSAGDSNGVTIAAGGANATDLALRVASSGYGAFLLTIAGNGAVAWSSGITNASGTPGSLCYNTSTFEMTKNNALTCTVSSRKFKTGILGLPVNGFDKLRPVQFEYKDNLARRRYGFIAEEAATADRRFADGYDANGNNPTSIDQNAILAATVAEVQSLKQRMTIQDKEIARLRRLIHRRR